MLRTLIVSLISFQLIFQSPGIYAQSSSHEQNLLAALHAAQGKTIPISKKQEILNTATDYLKQNLKKKYNLDDKKLATLLIENTPEAIKFRSKLYLCDDPNDLKTCNVRNIYSGINSLASTMALSGQMNQCKDHFDPKWLQDQPITQSLLNAEADFDPKCEGAISSSSIVLYSKGTTKGKTSAWSVLYSGSSLATLVNSSDAIITASALNIERTFFGKKFPKFDEVKSFMTDRDYAGIMMQEELNEAVYERAVVNSLSTKYSIKASFGAADYKSLTDPTAMLKEISLACVHCDDKEKENIRLRLLNILNKKIPKDVREGKNHQDVIASKICNQLNKKGYFDQWKNKPDLAKSELLPGEVFVYSTKVKKKSTSDPKDKKLDLSFLKKGSNLKGVYGDGPRSASDTAYYDQVFEAERKNKMANTNGIAELAMQGKEGLLLLTDALTSKNEDHEATKVNLSCSSHNREADAALIESAVNEIDKNVQAYLDDLNSNVGPIQPLNKSNVAKTSKNQAKALKYIVSKNPTAAGEALQDHPLSTKLMCSTLADIFYDQFWENDKKALIIVGGVTASILTAGLASVPLAILGNLAITTALTVEQYAESEAASEDYKDFKNAFFAQHGKDTYSRDEMQAAYVEWQALKLDWSTAFGYVPDVLSMGTLLKQYHTFAALRKAIPLLKKTEQVNELKLIVTEAKTIETRIIQKEIGDELDKIRKLQQSGASKTEVDLAIRSVYTNPKFKYDDVADAMLKDVRESSDKLKVALKKSPKDETLRTYDYVYVGAGIHTGIAKSTFAEQLAAQGLKSPKVLTIEATDNVSVFGRLGSSFRGNTLESAKLGTEGLSEADRLFLVAESKNYQAGSPIQVADYGKTQVPVAGQFQAPAMSSHWQTEGDYLLGSPVKNIKEIKKSSGEILYEIEMKTGETVYSKNIVMGTGLGKGKLPTTDVKSVEYIKSQAGKPDQKVFFVEDLLEGINNKASAGENFRAPFEGKKVIVVGGGHGGAIGIEAIEGIGPEALYKKVPGSENNKGPSSYLWVNLKAQTGNEFKKVIGGGDRYYGLAPLIDNGKIETNQLYLNEVLPNGKGGIKVSFLDKVTNKPVLDASGKIAYTEGDYLVYATGYENQTSGMLKSFAGKDGVQFDPIMANITPNDPRLVHDVPVTVGTQVMGADGKGKNIFVVGPSAGQIPHAKDPGGSTSVTINLFGSRSEALGKFLAKQAGSK